MSWGTSSDPRSRVPVPLSQRVASSVLSKTNSRWWGLRRTPARPRKPRKGPRPPAGRAGPGESAGADRPDDGDAAPEEPAVAQHVDVRLARRDGGCVGRGDGGGPAEEDVVVAAGDLLELVDGNGLHESVLSVKNPWGPGPAPDAGA